MIGYKALNHAAYPSLFPNRESDLLRSAQTNKPKVFVFIPPVSQTPPRFERMNASFRLWFLCPPPGAAQRNNHSTSIEWKVYMG